MIDKKRFTIGSPVVVRAVVGSTYEEDTKSGWKDNSKVLNRKELSPFLLGWVTGGTYIYDGFLCKNVESYDYRYYNGDPPEVVGSYFVPTKTNYVWLVRFGLTNKEVKVLDEDLDESLNSNTKNVPLRHMVPPPYYINVLKEEMGSWPRDKKGRWLKKS
jgi:hypothetical protein